MADLTEDPLGVHESLRKIILPTDMMTPTKSFTCSLFDKGQSAERVPICYGIFYFFLFYNTKHPRTDDILNPDLTFIICSYQIAVS